MEDGLSQFNVILFFCCCCYRVNTGNRDLQVTIDMSGAAQAMPLLTRVVTYSVAIANNAGKIIREIMKKGELGIIQKEVCIHHVD